MLRTPFLYLSSLSLFLLLLSSLIFCRGVFVQRLFWFKKLPKSPYTESSSFWIILPFWVWTLLENHIPDFSKISPEDMLLLLLLRCCLCLRGPLFIFFLTEFIYYFWLISFKRSTRCNICPSSAQLSQGFPQTFASTYFVFEKYLIF